MFRINVSGQTPLHLFVLMLMALGPLSTTFLNKPVIVFLFGLGLLAVFFAALWQHPIRFWHIAAWPSICYVALMFWALFAIILHRDVLTGDYLSSVIWGRLFTLITAVISLFLVNWWLVNASEDQLKKTLWVAFAILLLFILLAIWQFIGNIIGIKFFIETRDWMHGVPTSLRNIVPKRLTSIAEEPNFLSPLLFEFAILVFVLVNRKLLKWLLISATGFVLIFSFSGGAYVNLILLILFYSFLTFFFSLLKGRIGYFSLLFPSLIIVISLLIILWGQPIVEFAYYKLQTESSGESMRSRFFETVIDLYGSGSFLDMLLGHGMATMSVLYEFGIPIQEQIFKITNNFYLDMLWESGVLGIFFIFIMFFLLLIPGFKFYSKNRFFAGGLFFAVQLIITSMYRSEYLSTHFIFVFSVILVLYRLGNRNLFNDVVTYK